MISHLRSRIVKGRATGENVLNQSSPNRLETTVESAFITALLLTGSMERAEAAVLDGIAALDSKDGSVDSLVSETILAASLTARENGLEGHAETTKRASSMLPFELRSVLHLPAPLRHCFVLRILAGLPRDVCASLLQLDVEQVDDGTCAALPMLANIQGHD
jgi:hypothetical protein